MHPHHFGVHRRQDQADGGVSRRAECAEDISVFVTRVDGRAPPDPLRPPTARTRSFLSYPAFILTPEFDDFIGVLFLNAGEYFREFF